MFYDRISGLSSAKVGNCGPRVPISRTRSTNLLGPPNDAEVRSLISNPSLAHGLAVFFFPLKFNQSLALEDWDWSQWIEFVQSVNRGCQLPAQGHTNQLGPPNDAAY